MPPFTHAHAKSLKGASNVAKVLSCSFTERIGHSVQSLGDTHNYLKKS